MGGFRDDNSKPSDRSDKVGLKQVSSKPSIFDNQPKKPSQATLEKNVAATQERLTGHKKAAAELTVRFQKIMTDKTLPGNQNVLSSNIEMELLKDMMIFASEVNNDPNESDEGIGSLGLIAILLKTCITQRNRINELDYSLNSLNKRADAMDTLLKAMASSIDTLKKNG
jgi:hypothetical protein